ncbi:MAG TPA: DUF4833 domain-containing protein [Polyangiaceae bacterium]|nr:DUF4833 domain-containing protein [Polyangiaceae bacterium]
MQRRAFTGLLLTAASGWSRVAGAASLTRLLFTIARSKNANVVQYAARLEGSRLEPAAPIDVYWLMLAEDGRREALSWAERKLAYGFVVSKASADGCGLSLVAFKERPIQIERGSGGFRAMAMIAGQRAVLKRIFVQASEGALLPSVQHLDVFGTSLDGVSLRERISRR